MFYYNTLHYNHLKLCIIDCGFLCWGSGVIWILTICRLLWSLRQHVDMEAVWCIYIILSHSHAVMYKIPKVYATKHWRQLPCPCSPMVKPLGRHVQYSVTFAVAEDRFKPWPWCVRLLKELFQIIPMHMMTREIIPGRKTGLDGVLYKLWPFVSDIAIFVLKRDVKLQLTN